MVLSDPDKSGLESGAWVNGYDFEKKAKILHVPLQKIRVCYFFRAVYHSKNHVVPHPVNAIILDVILNI